MGKHFQLNRPADLKSFFKGSVNRSDADPGRQGDDEKKREQTTEHERQTLVIHIEATPVTKIFAALYAEFIVAVSINQKSFTIEAATGLIGVRQS
jgi:hypothetical protein